MACTLVLHLLLVTHDAPINPIVVQSVDSIHHVMPPVRYVARARARALDMRRGRLGRVDGCGSRKGVSVGNAVVGVLVVVVYHEVQGDAPAGVDRRDSMPWWWCSRRDCSRSGIAMIVDWRVDLLRAGHQ